MKDFTIALVQHASPIGQVEKNLDVTAAFARKAKKKGADLVCFPELSITGHGGHPLMIRHAQPVPDGQACQRLIALAKELDVHLSAGIAETDSGTVYNTQFVVGPQGYIGKQRKVHLSSDEYFYFRHGTQLPVLDLPFVRLGIVICYDNQIPETARTLAVKGAEVLFCPHAARAGKWHADKKQRAKVVKWMKDNWMLVHRCRAYDNGAYVVVNNTAGNSTKGNPELKGVVANHFGGCMVIDPKGDVIAQSRARDVVDEMIVVKLSAAPVHQRREQACFNLRTRRVEAFAALSAPTD